MKKIRKKLSLMLATLKKKRRYYTELEYLESTGTQYIDTGILPSEDLRTKVVQAYTGTSIDRNVSIFGSNGYNVDNRYWVNYDRHFEIGYGSYLATEVVVQPNELNTIDFNYIKDGSHYFSFNGTEYTKTGTPNTQYSIILFGRVVSTQAPVLAPQRIYKVQFIRNDVLIGDFIPVLDWDMTPCMYDKVSGQLFYNQGIGDFSYGREIHYVEYIESTGTQWINTNVVTESGGNYRFVLDFNYSNGSDDDTLFGGRIAGGNRSPLLYYNSVTGGFAFNYAGYNSQQSPTNTINVSKDERHVFDLSINDTTKKSNVIVDGAAYYSNVSYSGNIYSGYPIGIFCDYASGTAIELASYKFYSFVIYKDEEAIRDYIPAIDENGVCFMFDRVSHTIYDNDGTGTFKYPAIELEYIESDGNQYIDTGVVLSSTDKVEVSVEYTGTPTQGSSYAFGTFGSNKNFGINCTLLSNPKNWYGVWYNQGTLTSSSIFSDLNTRYDIQVSSGGMYINDNLMTTVSGTFTGSISAYLFWAHGTGQPKSLMKLYSCKMWQGSNLVRNFIPCYKDGVLGLFDKVNDVFYDNDGTGTFTGGKIVEPEYE